jgi:ribosomal protein L40E
MLDIYKELTKEDSLRFAGGDIANKAYIWMSIANDSMSRTDFKRGYFYLKYFDANLQDKLAAEISSKLIEVNKVFEYRNIREAKLTNQFQTDNKTYDKNTQPNNDQADIKHKETSKINEGISFCRKCGNKLPEDSLFCTKCGSKVKDVFLICEKCKKEISPDSEYCQFCGEKAVKKAEI